MPRDEPQFGDDRQDMPPPERRWTAAGRTRMAPQKFEIAGLSGSRLMRSIKAWATRPLLASHGVLCTVLLCAAMASGTAALGQTTSNSAADRAMADRYDRAARTGDDVAQFYLGSLYAQGVGRPQSDTEAFAWIQEAARRGNAQAMMVAAGLTALGKGTPKDYVVSYKWAFLVAEGSQTVDLKNGGRQLITMLQPRMTADQIQSAKTQAYQFRAIGTPAAAPAVVPPTVVAPAPAAPALQPTTPTGGPQQPAKAPPPTVSTSSDTPAQKSVALEAQKHMSKENVDRMMKNVPQQYRKRFGF